LSRKNGALINARYALAVTLGCCFGCATTSTVRIDQGQVPKHLQALERTVLEDSSNFKHLLAAQGALYEDPTLQAYLDQLFQPLLPAVSSSLPYHFSLKVVRDPTLNAFTLGDGTVYVNTGLIARVKTSQQFAFVVGHELAHVMNRDLLYFTDSVHRKTVAAKLTGLVVTPALSAVGLGELGDLGLGLAYAASVTGYGREREDQADHDSLVLMRRLGYDEREAIRMFDTLLTEEERYQRGIEFGFLSSHPSNEHRLDAAKAFIGPKALETSTPLIVDEPFLTATQRLRIENAALNLQLDRYDHAMSDLQLMLRRSPHDVAAHCYVGDAYRLMAEDPKKLKAELNSKTWKDLYQGTEEPQQRTWQDRARQEYERAMSLDPHFPDPYRGLGLLHQAQGKSAEALSDFQRYLELNPTAKDRRFVLSMMRRIQDAVASPQEK